MESAKPVSEITKDASSTHELPDQKKSSSMSKEQSNSKKGQPADLKRRDTFDINSDPKRFTWEFGRSEYCQIGWCAVAQLRTGCTCTEELHPCAYCMDMPSVYNKLCDSCKDRD